LPLTAGSIRVKTMTCANTKIILEKKQAVSTNKVIQFITKRKNSHVGITDYIKNKGENPL